MYVRSRESAHVRGVSQRVCHVVSSSVFSTKQESVCVCVCVRVCDCVHESMHMRERGSIWGQTSVNEVRLDNPEEIAQIQAVSSTNGITGDRSFRDDNISSLLDHLN